jgi:hypothetical protein
MIILAKAKKYIDVKEIESLYYNLTKKIIEALNEKSKKIVVYSTCELWNKYSGGIDISEPFNFYPTPYLNSKYKKSQFVIENKNL